LQFIADTAPSHSPRAPDWIRNVKQEKVDGEDSLDEGDADAIDLNLSAAFIVKRGENFDPSDDLADMNDASFPDDLKSLPVLSDDEVLKPPFYYIVIIIISNIILYL